MTTILPMDRSARVVGPNTIAGHQFLLHSVSGASSGAMAEILLSTGISPREALNLALGITLGSFADSPGWGAEFRGDRFEGIMRDYNCERMTDGR